MALAESRAEHGARLDVGGAVLVAAALVALVLALIEGRQHDWPAWTWICFAASAPLLAAFAALQRRIAARGEAPLVPPRLFGERGFTVGLLVSVTFYTSMASFFLILAIYLQEGRGLSALDSGLVFTPLALGYLIASGVSEKLAPRLGRQVLAIGGLVRVGGLLALAATVGAIGLDASPWALVPALFVDGVGMGLLTAPLVSTVLARMAASDAGAASGVLSAAQQIGNTIGIAAIGALFYGAVGSDGNFDGAFRVSLLALAGVSLAVAALVQLLPSGSAAANAPVEPTAPPTASDSVDHGDSRSRRLRPRLTR
jgi:predicted MFS family arabinose efflux permease